MPKTKNLRLASQAASQAPDALFPGPSQGFQTDWFGEPTVVACRFQLDLEERTLRYRFWCDAPPNCDESVEYMEFRSGLWEADVAELFLAGPDGGYLELNLSPTGGWWAAEFSDYRQMSRELPDLALAVEVRRSLTGWEVQCELGLDSLRSWGYTDWEEVPMKVCAIVHRESPMYLCTDPSPGEPDFHSQRGYHRPTLVSRP